MRSWAHLLAWLPSRTLCVCPGNSAILRASETVWREQRKDGTAHERRHSPTQVKYRIAQLLSSTRKFGTILSLTPRVLLSLFFHFISTVPHSHTLGREMLRPFCRAHQVHFFPCQLFFLPKKIWDRLTLTRSVSLVFFFLSFFFCWIRLSHARQLRNFVFSANGFFFSAKFHSR